MESSTVNGKRTPPTTNGHMNGREGVAAPVFKKVHSPQAVTRFVHKAKFEAQKSALPLTDRLQKVMGRVRVLERAEQYDAAQELQFWATKKMAGIALDLDTYDDIFNDFEDLLPYSEREISEDFLKLLRKYQRENPKGGFEIYLMIPASERDEVQEEIIRHRLREHFEQELTDIKKDRKQDVILGLKYLSVGSVLLAIETYLTFQVLQQAEYLLVLLAEVLAIPTWHFSDEAYRIFKKPREQRALESFYSKFIDCKYIFVPIDDS